MKVSELMVGNLYLYHMQDHQDDRKEWWEPSIMDLESMVWLQRCPDDKDYKPMPLTRFLLEKAGFKRHNEFFVMWKLENIIIDEDEDEEGNIIYTFSWDGVDCDLELTYVHQLQNLFKVLKGKELEFRKGLAYENN